MGCGASNVAVESQKHQQGLQLKYKIHAEELNFGELSKRWSSLLGIETSYLLLQWRKK